MAEYVDPRIFQVIKLEDYNLNSLSARAFHAAVQGTRLVNSGLVQDREIETTKKKFEEMRLTNVKEKVYYHRGGKTSKEVWGYFASVEDMMTNPSELEKEYLRGVARNINMLLVLTPMEIMCYRALNRLYADMRSAKENWALIDQIPESDKWAEKPYSPEAYRLISALLNKIPGVGYCIVLAHGCMLDEENILVWGWETDLSPKPHVYRDLENLPTGMSFIGTPPVDGKVRTQGKR